MRSKHVIPVVTALILLVILAGCAGPNPSLNTQATDGHVAGFLQGAWNGFTAMWMFIYSLFEPKAHFYEVHNNGAWYNLGFIWGAAMFFGGGGRASSRSKGDKS